MHEESMIIVFPFEKMSTTRFVGALQTFNSQHLERNRIEGAQRTTIENLSLTVDSLRAFNTASDVVYDGCVDLFPRHLQLLTSIRRELTNLEQRVTHNKARALRIAEHDNADISFLDQ